MKFENRTNIGLEATAEGKLVGYAAVFDSPSHDLGGFREIVKPGAFTRSLTEFPDVLALVEHNPAFVLGRTTNGTLRIIQDTRGLRVEIDPANTSYARDIVELVRRGDVAGMSFRFKPFPGGAFMDPKSGIRTLSSVQLREVSVVVDPAYPAASVEARSAFEEVQREHIRHAHQRMRLQLAQIN